MKRRATSIWKGSGKEGAGQLSGPSGVLDQTPYSFKSRFENEDGKKGTNPEELIAAAHAGCFNMALSFALNEEGYTAESLATDATITIEKNDDGFAFTSINLKLEAVVPEISESKFKEIAASAKAGCPVSKALSNVPIELEISFSQG